MPRPVPTTAETTPIVDASENGLRRWSATAFRVFGNAIRDIGNRLNGSIHEDGQIPMQRPLVLATYTVATLPAASDWEGGIVYVSDGAAGAKFRGSDGSTWVNLG